MSQAVGSQVLSPVKGDIVLTRKGHRRLWDGRHWRVLCRISDCKAQRQGSLYNKFGLCKKHYTEMNTKQSTSIKSLPNIEQKKPKQVVVVEKQDQTNRTCKRHNLNVIVDRIRRAQIASKMHSIKGSNYK